MRKLSTTKTTKPAARSTIDKPAARSTIDWSFLSNRQAADAFKRFVSGSSTVTEIRAEFKNTEYSRIFNRLLRDRKADKARNVARLALKRRNLI